MDEYECGYNYAKWMHEEEGETEPVDIEKEVHCSVEIPDDDCTWMENHGIANPSARRYWQGYNDYMATLKKEEQNND